MFGPGLWMILLYAAIVWSYCMLLQYDDATVCCYCMRMPNPPTAWSCCMTLLYAATAVWATVRSCYKLLRSVARTLWCYATMHYTVLLNHYGPTAY
eukprot:2487071-Rhodomonas_salina.1